VDILGTSDSEKKKAETWRLLREMRKSSRDWGRQYRLVWENLMILKPASAVRILRK
jgi:hypothetical protein